jgi:hypothetical protein
MGAIAFAAKASRPWGAPTWNGERRGGSPDLLLPASPHFAASSRSWCTIALSSSG